ncbi:MAG: phosphodiester glycosidase family protein [Clostridiales bacterium]|nr:phosphodiester glycosidase family protein [Clostridiales bacterium]
MRHQKPLPGILVILLDLLGIGAALGIFYLFAFVVSTSDHQPLQRTASTAEPTLAVANPTPETDASTLDAPPAPEVTPTPVLGDFSATFPTGELDAANAIGSYADDNLRIVITEHHTDNAVYFAADIWVRDVHSFQTAFAGGKFKGGYAMPDAMASKAGAILALSGDSCGSASDGIVIRNGDLYRDTKSGDVCILYLDGTMETYYEADFDLDAAIARGAYQSWSFGPKLIDNGQIPNSYNSTDIIINNRAPRAAIGYYEPGHYCLVSVDGRQGDYSRGMNLDELAQAMIDLGCKDAYNLDGGQSVMMVFQGQIIGKPYKGGRVISDIIYFGGAAPQG